MTIVSKGSEYINSFLSYIRIELGLSSNSIASYSVDLNQFKKWVDKNFLYIHSIDESNVEKYVRHLAKERNLQSSTVNRKIASIRGFFFFLRKKKIISINPAASLSSIGDSSSLPKSMSLRDVETLLNAPDCQTFIGLRDKTMLELMYATGVRSSELVNLQYGDIDLNRSLIKVMGKGGKERMIPFGDDALSSLIEYIDFRRKNNLSLNSREFFISQQGKKITRQAFWHRIKTYLKVTGLSLDISPHTLRHAFATHLLNNGADLRSLQMLLGHSDLSTTQIYTHIAKQQLGKLIQDHHPRG